MFNLWLYCKYLVLTGKYYCSRIGPWPPPFFYLQHKVKQKCFEKMMNISRALFCNLGVSQILLDTRGNLDDSNSNSHSSFFRTPPLVTGRSKILGHFLFTPQDSLTRFFFLLDR
jgi:hypothetical protein